MPGTVLQSAIASAAPDGSTTITANLSGVKAGSRLIVASAIWTDFNRQAVPSAWYTAPTSLPFVEDGRGAFAPIGDAAQGQGQQVAAASCEVGNFTGDITVAVDFASKVYGHMVVLEVAALATGAKDKAAGDGASNTADITPTAGPTAGLAAPGDFLLAVLGATTDSGSTADIGAAVPSGWTRHLYVGDASTQAAIAVDSRTAADATGQSVAWGTVGTHANAWSSLIVAYRATGAAPQGPGVSASGGTATIPVAGAGGDVAISALPDPTAPPAPAPVPEAGLPPPLHLRQTRGGVGAALLASAPPNVGPPGGGDEPVYAGAQQIFYDDFPGTELDRGKWRQVMSGERGGFVMAPEAVIVRNGLVIRTSWNGSRWISGGVHQGTGAQQYGGFRYGQVSIRARVWPGQGYGPALGLGPAVDGGKDIIVLAAPAASKTAGRHGVLDSGTGAGNMQEFACDLSRWHTHTVRWEDDRLYFYLNNELVRTASNILVADAMALFLQGHVETGGPPDYVEAGYMAADYVAGGGTGPYGGAPNDYGDKYIEIAYVRVMQLPGGGGGGGGTGNPGGGMGGGTNPAPTRSISVSPTTLGSVAETTAGAGAAVQFTIRATGPANVRHGIVKPDGTPRTALATVANGGAPIVVGANFLFTGDRYLVEDAADAGLRAVTESITVVPAAGGAVAFREDFTAASGTGKLSHVWGDTAKVQNLGTGEIRINGSSAGAGVMEFPGGANKGHGYGYFEIRCKATGGLGSGSGPAALTWPATDRWPGPEVDMFEIVSGRGYGAIHWRGENGTPEGADVYHSVYYPTSLDWTQYHTYGMLWEPGKITYFVDEVEQGGGAEPAQNTGKDYANGGENKVLGFMNRSPESTITVDFVQWTPLADYKSRRAFPTAPHIRVFSAHGACVVGSQNGLTADVRMVLPAYAFSHILTVEVHGTAAKPSKPPYWGNDPAGYLATQNGMMSIDRDLTTQDYGQYATTIYQELNDGTYLALPVQFSVADTATGPVPSPRAPAPLATTAMFEDFQPRRGAGIMQTTFGDTHDDGAGNLVIPGHSSAMQLVHPQKLNVDGYGHGNGLYEFRVRFVPNAAGSFRGDGTGPALILWPSDDKYPGPEIDLSEFFFNDDPATPGGAQYVAVHWAIDGRNGEGGTANNDDNIWVIQDNTAIVPVRAQWNPRAAHTYAAKLENTRLTFYVDGIVLAVETEHPAPDRINGGRNHSFGILNASSDVTVICEWIRFTPLSAL